MTACLACGKMDPPGHVVVIERRGEEARRGDAVRVGRVCSSHTVKELILHPSDRLSVEVFYDTTPDERPL